MYHNALIPGILLFGSLLIDRLNQEHPLIKLSKVIDWLTLTKEIATFYFNGIGRPSTDLRLLCGLLILQYMYKLSDNNVVQAWTENQYFQAFTGSTLLSNDYPCDPSTLSNFRNRIGIKGAELIFKHSVLIHDEEVLESETIIDSTVQPKYTTYPTDSKLMLAIINQYWRFENHLGLKFSHEYHEEVSLLKKNINFCKSKKSLPGKELKILRLREIGNDLLNQINEQVHPETANEPLFIKCMKNYRKAVNQNKHDSNKIYSIYEPDVACIAKGKSNKKYEFGNKVSVLLGLRHKVIVGVKSFRGAPYDGDTIEPTLDMSYNTFNGYKPEKVIGDLGYRGRHDVNGVRVITPDDYRLAQTPDQKAEIGKMLSDRSTIEPIIGHLKSDHHLGRNMLHGVVGDAMNALLSAAAFNLKKYVRLEETRLAVAFTAFYGKRYRRPKRKTKAVPFSRPQDAARLFPICSGQTLIAPLRA